MTLTTFYVYSDDSLQAATRILNAFDLFGLSPTCATIERRGNVYETVVVQRDLSEARARLLLDRLLAMVLVIDGCIERGELDEFDLTSPRERVATL